MTRPTRYTENSSSRDWIDEFCATSSAEEARGAFRFTIGKYLRRYGKKDDPLQEAIKIQDYANRLVEFERAQATVKQSLTVEPASLIDDESPRMQAIAQNGNDGAAYSEIDRLRTAADFNGGVPVTVDEAVRLGAFPGVGSCTACITFSLPCTGACVPKEPQQPRHRCLVCAGGHATHECGAGQ